MPVLMMVSSLMRYEAVLLSLKSAGVTVTCFGKTVEAFLLSVSDVSAPFKDPYNKLVGWNVCSVSMLGVILMSVKMAVLMLLSATEVTADVTCTTSSRLAALKS